MYKINQNDIDGSLYRVIRRDRKTGAVIGVENIFMDSGKWLFHKNYYRNDKFVEAGIDQIDIDFDVCIEKPSNVNISVDSDNELAMELLERVKPDIEKMVGRLMSQQMIHVIKLIIEREIRDMVQKYHRHKNSKKMRDLVVVFRHNLPYILNGGKNNWGY